MLISGADLLLREIYGAEGAAVLELIVSGGECVPEPPVAPRPQDVAQVPPQIERVLNVDHLSQLGLGCPIRIVDFSGCDTTSKIVTRRFATTSKPYF